ncbi:hypothetical protein EVAR_29016_1 [Eumeta japonica]|uniref:Uncharacterized protein n=1 Tax=Eumeta variegata TaxID=151549 RepID=A0A4C1W1S9_EUMVA|nr:hypothetical protein EVAR_29016_1 [Eumeta japonica]
MRNLVLMDPAVDAMMSIPLKRCGAARQPRHHSGLTNDWRGRAAVCGADKKHDSTKYQELHEVMMELLDTSAGPRAAVQRLSSETLPNTNAGRERAQQWVFNLEALTPTVGQRRRIEAKRFIHSSIFYGINKIFKLFK